MIYLDNAATTKVYNDVIYLLEYYAKDFYYNPSALYGQAVQLTRDIAKARRAVADVLNAKPGEIVFTGSGSESDNMAIWGSVKSKDRPVITCIAEHAAVYQCFHELKNRGYAVKFIGTDACGRADLAQLKALLTPDTQFVSVMHVNNETGAVNDIAGIVSMVKSVAPRCIVHSDGVQAYCKRSVDVAGLGVDLYSFSGHKIHCVKGVGGLYIRSGVNLPPLIWGGGQESGRRSGTENVAGIAALGLASELTFRRLSENAAHFAELKQRFLGDLQSTVSDIVVNSPIGCTQDNIVNVSIADIRAEVLLHMLEEDGIVIGLGSACSARHRASRMTEALGLDDRLAQGTIRVSFSDETTAEEVAFAAQRIAAHTEKLRRTIRRNA